jgi:hypothetical protein
LEDIRKVTFFLEKDPGYGMFDVTEEEQKEIDEKSELRRGFFHGFGNEVIIIENETFKNTYAIIEELETGIVFQVAPKNIHFIN